jgi:hypothetical protein
MNRNRLPPPAIRHDSWTGEKMAIFCETLAETAVVAETTARARVRARCVCCVSGGNWLRH